jgi:hypothetical protein
VDAVPFASVTAVPGEMVPPPAVTVNETVTPDTGASEALVTSKTIGDGSVLPTGPVCSLPLTGVIAAGVDVGLVESAHAAATAVTSAHNIVLPRVAVISEVIAVSTFLGVLNDCSSVICYNTRTPRNPIARADRGSLGIERNFRIPTG